jgi:hypothetical protein
LAGVARLELATIGFGDRCSTNWNYTPVDVGHYAKRVLKGKVFFIKSVLTGVFSSKTGLFIAILSYFLSV